MIRQFRPLYCPPVSSCRSSATAVTAASWSRAHGITLNTEQPASMYGWRKSATSFRSPVGRIALERLERHLVEGLHSRSKRHGSGAVGAKPHQTLIACSKPLGSLPAWLACSATCSTTELNRRGETQIPNQPSPNRPARRTAASDRPPTISGIGGEGAGMMSASSEKNSPSKLTGFPSDNARRIWDSSIRRPTVLGSTPQISSSCRSSPPIPTPNIASLGELGDAGKLACYQHRVT